MARSVARACADVPQCKSAVAPGTFFAESLHSQILEGLKTMSGPAQWEAQMATLPPTVIAKLKEGYGI